MKQILINNDTLLMIHQMSNFTFLTDNTILH